MEYIKRNMEGIILELNKQYPAILVTGPRQVGKTTMLQKLIVLEGRNRNYVSLDDLNDRALAKTDPAMFFQIHQPPILIDEIQYAPELFTYIKIYADRDQRAGDFWMTGSQLFKLMDGVQESLAGRVALLHLSPLSQQEIYSGQAGAFSLDIDVLSKRQQVVRPALAPQIFDRIFLGGMPALVSKKYQERSIFYSSYINTYLERDVKDLSGSIDSLKFLFFLTAVAARTSQMVNYKGIADDCDMDQTTVKSWLRILETLGIIFYLHPYSSSSETAMSGAMNGALLENYTVSEIQKSYQNVGKEPYLYYYRDKDAKEIDLLMEGDGQLHPIEIKKTATPEKKMISNFSVIEKSSMQRGIGAVLCLSEKLGAFDKDNLIVPISLI